MVTKQPGRVRQRLAKLLQRSFPVSACGLALTWDAEWLYPAVGAYRSMLDCFCWEGFALHYRNDGSYFVAMEVRSYSPMSELIRAKRLSISSSGEVIPVDDDESANDALYSE